MYGLVQHLNHHRLGHRYLLFRCSKFRCFRGRHRLHRRRTRWWFQRYRLRYRLHRYQRQCHLLSHQLRRLHHHHRPKDLFAGERLIDRDLREDTGREKGTIARALRAAGSTAQIVSGDSLVTDDLKLTEISMVLLALTALVAVLQWLLAARARCHEGVRVRRKEREHARRVNSRRQLRRRRAARLLDGSMPLFVVRVEGSRERNQCTFELPVSCDASFRFSSKISCSTSLLM